MLPTKFLHIRTEGTQIYLYSKFQEIIFIRAKVKLCRKSLMKIELSIKWTCLSNVRVDKLSNSRLNEWEIKPEKLSYLLRF